jgi:hypothetical protein
VSRRGAPVGGRLVLLAASWGAGFLAPASALGQEALEPVASRFAQAWQTGDVDGLGEVLRASGLRLHLLGEDHLSIPPRQVEAAIRGLLGRYFPGETQISRVATAGGDPAKGFADIRWRTGPRRGGEAVTFTLFVAFQLGEEGWEVAEIRVLPPSNLS